MITGHQREAYLAGYEGKPMPPWVSKSLPMLYEAYKQGKKDKKMNDDKIKRVKEYIRSWAKKAREDRATENIEDKDFIGEKIYIYNTGQIDILDSILAQLDRWFEEA
jgi:hypothetical protein